MRIALVLIDAREGRRINRKDVTDNGVVPALDHPGVFAQVVHGVAGFRAVPTETTGARQQRMVRLTRA
jgi:hypothetical protein